MNRINNRENLSECSVLQNPERSHNLWKRSCCSLKDSDGFNVISTCFFVLTIAVTCSLIIQIHYGNSEMTPHGAVASDDRLCSEIGVNFMRKEGTAVDAIVASLLCLSVIHPHLVGPGGGGVMLIHNHRANASRLFDFMVEIPKGGKVGVPGFLKGLEKVHRLYGKLSWKTLFQPAINLARYGFNVSRELTKALSEVKGARFSQNFKNEFYPKTLAAMPGHTLKREKFAQFLEHVSIGGADELYLKYGIEMMEAFQFLQSNLTIHDFHQYEVKERDPLIGQMNNVSITTAGVPFGGFQTLLGLELMKDVGVTSYTGPDELYLAFSKGLHLGAAFSKILATSDGYNFTEMNPFLFEASFQNLTLDEIRPEASPMPASQVSAVDTFDLYAAAVVGLGDIFGSGFMTKHGIIVNGGPEMPKDIDYGFDGRRPTSFTPLIAVDSNNICGQRVVLSSGSWSSMMQTVTQLILRNLDLTSAIVEPKIALGDHPTDLLLNDLDPRVKKLATLTRQHLKKNNFTLKLLHVPQVVNGVSKIGDSLLSHSDIGGGGIAARLDENANSEKIFSSTSESV